MSLTLPTLSNDYLIEADFPLDPSHLSALFGDIATRIKTLQALTAGFEDAVSDAAIALAAGKLDLSVTPTLNALNDRVNQITALLSDAEDRLAAIQAGGVPAVNVPVATGGRYPANSNAQSAFVLLDSALTEVEADITALGAAIAAIQFFPAETLLASANSNLVAGKAYRVIATGITLTLPAAPATGAAIRIVDGGVLSSSATSSLARNGKTIMGLAEDLTLDIAGIDFVIWYNGTTWKLQ